MDWLHIYLDQEAFVTLIAVDFEILDSMPFFQDPFPLDVVPTYLHAYEAKAIFFGDPIGARWTHLE